MPPQKKTASSQKRERAVPVRVVRTARPVRQEIAELTPMSAPVTPMKQQPKSPMNNRRKMMWTGVIVVSAVVFVLWIGYMKQSLTTSSNNNDSFFTKIARDLKDVFSKFKLPGSNTENANDRALNELRNSVFPEIKVENTNTVVNSNANNGLNANTNVNTVSNINLNVNTNATTNTVTP